MNYNKIRRNAKELAIGNRKIGGRNPIASQSMTNADTRDAAATVAQIRALEAAGCDIVRVSVPSLEAAETILNRNGLTIEDITWFIPHQANIRIVQTLAQQLHIPMEHFVCNIEHTGNTSAASIPIAFTQAKKAGCFRKGNRILLVAFGAGLTWGATLIEW